MIFERRKRNSSIPLDIVLDILSRIPVKSLLRFKCVSKSWYNLLTHDSSFIKLHLDRSTKKKQYSFMFTCLNHICSIDYFRCRPLIEPASPALVNSPFESDDARLLPIIHGGSCRGVFLVGDSRQCFLYLLNPATQEYKKLPESLTRFPRKYQVYGLGYDTLKEDYKVVIIYFDYRYNTESRISYYESGGEVCVYSLTTNSVKRIQDIPYLIHQLGYHEKIPVSGGIFVSSAIHWVLQVPEIVAFDFSTEEYKQLPVPDSIVKNRDSVVYLIGELKDCLCLSTNHFHNGDINVFIMLEYGVKQSWTKSFTLNNYRHPGYGFRPLCFHNDKEVIFEWSCSRGTGTLILYGPDEGSIKYLDTHDFPPAIPEWFHSFDFETYVESLVSFNPITFVEDT